MMRLFPSRKNKRRSSSSVDASVILLEAEREETEKREEVLTSSFSQPCRPDDEHFSTSSLDSRLTQSINTNFYQTHQGISNTDIPESVEPKCKACWLIQKRSWTKSIQAHWPNACTCSVEESSSENKLPSAITDVHSEICNIFWKSSLTFHPYTQGSKLVDFGSLWPVGSHLGGLLVDLYRLFGSGTKMIDVINIVISCGPLRVLKEILALKLHDINSHGEGGELLHKACMRQNMQASIFLTASGINPGIQDKKGRTADQVCYSRQIYEALPMKYKAHDVLVLGSPLKATDPLAAQAQAGQSSLTPLTASLKQLIFTSARDPKHMDDMLVMLQTTDFDLNTERDSNDDLLVHVAAQQGIAGLPLLYMLHKTYNATLDIPGSHGMTCLMMAVILTPQDPIFVDSMLCMFGSDPNIVHEDTRWTALHYACQNNHFESTSTLVRRGADVNVEDKQGCRADDIAALCCHDDCCQVIAIKREQRMWMLTSLIQQDNLGIDDVRKTDICSIDRRGYTLIMIAARNNSVASLRSLLAFPKAPINAQHMETLETALCMAAHEGHTEAVECLLKHGALASLRTITGELALHIAVKSQHITTVCALLQHTSSLVGLQAALHLSTSAQLKDLLHSAITRRQTELVTPALFECAVNGDAQRLYCILEEGDNVSPTCSGGDWPLSLAVENGHYDVVCLLIQHWGDYRRVHTPSQNTLLHLASARGYIHIVTHLLELLSPEGPCNSYDRSLSKMVNALNVKHQTPLVMAAERGYIGVVRKLMEYGASTAVMMLPGRLYCCTQYQGIQYLIEMERRKHTQQVMQAISTKTSIDYLKTVFMERFDHNLRSDVGDTPLMLACLLGKQNIVRFLLQSATYTLSASDSFTSLTKSVLKDSKSVLKDSKYEYDTDSGTELDGHNTISTQPCTVTTDEVTANKISGNPPAGQLSKARITIGGNSSTSSRGSHNKMAMLTNEKPDGINYDNPGQIGGKGDQVMPRSSSAPVINPNESSGPKQRQYSSFTASLRMTDEESSNIPAFMNHITHISQGSIYDQDKNVNHLCAVNPRDGATVYHRLVQNADNVLVLEDLLQYDVSGVNIQDNQGLSPVHLACKLARKKCVAKLVGEVYVDLNSRTLDGRLPEEMTSNRKLSKLITESRQQKPKHEAQCPLRSIPSSMYGGESGAASTLDFDRLNTRFLQMKHQGYDGRM